MYTRVNNYYKFRHMVNSGLMFYIWKERASIMAELIFISFVLIYWLANTLYYDTCMITVSPCPPIHSHRAANADEPFCGVHEILR